MVRRHREGRSSVAFTTEELVTWREFNRSCWTGDEWVSSINDRLHYNIVACLKSPLDYKLLYDSYLWRLILEKSGWVPLGRVLELLPGDSFTIPMALEGVRFHGELHRLDLIPRNSACGLFSFKTAWVSQNVWLSDAIVDNYDLVVGNHIIDDLLAYLHFPDPALLASFYSDPERALSAWTAIIGSPNLEDNKENLIELFIRLVTALCTDAMLVLRQYPSTFALRCGDVGRISTVQDTFRRICESLSTTPRCCVTIPDLNAMPVPVGSKYPGSFVIATRI